MSRGPERPSTSKGSQRRGVVGTGATSGTAGAWEYWCWDPQMGWWYATSEDGKKKFVRMNQPGFVVNSV